MEGAQTSLLEFLNIHRKREGYPTDKLSTPRWQPDMCQNVDCRPETPSSLTLSPCRDLPRPKAQALHSRLFSPGTRLTSRWNPRRLSACALCADWRVAQRWDRDRVPRDAVCSSDNVGLLSEDEEKTKTATEKAGVASWWLLNPNPTAQAADRSGPLRAETSATDVTLI
jgi:hypothetical protein